MTQAWEVYSFLHGQGSQAVLAKGQGLAAICRGLASYALFTHKPEEEKKNKTKPRGGQRYKRDTEEPPFVSREEN
jgi:hypothetical protein